MAAEPFVDHVTPAVITSSEATEDVKHVLFHLGTILNSTNSNIISESTVTAPTVPTQSSSEILSELFSAFNAEPPNIPENFQDVEPPHHSPSSLNNESLGEETSVERKIKTRRTGKKHKHKDKKHKHKKRKKIKEEGSDHLNLDSSSSSRPSPRVSPSSLLKTRIKEEGRESIGLDTHISSSRPTNCVKKEKVKSSTRTRSKHTKHAKVSLRSVKLKHGAADPKSSRLLGLSIKISNDLTYDQDPSLELIPDVELPSVNPNQCSPTDETNTSGPKGLADELSTGLTEYHNITPKIKIEPGTNPTEKQPSASTSEPCITVGQAKSTSKISIKSLKFSSVFEATVREVEEQAKAKAARYEEGELSNSDCDELVLSPISSEGSDGNKTVASVSSFYHSNKKKVKKHKKRHRSESRERSSKRHHSSKCIKSSKSERKFSDLCTSSREHKHHGRHKNKSENGGTAKKRLKRQHSIEKDATERRSTSKSPKHKRTKNADKNSSIPLKTPSKTLEVNHNMVASTSGRKTVEELTNFCKRLSGKEHRGKNRSDTDGDEEYNSDSETEHPFHHPFQVKERPQSIIVNIRNSIQLPVRSLQEKAADQSKHLRVQFPVSSGQRHRKAEDEWVPVSPKRDTVKKQPSLVDPSTKSTPAITPVAGVAPVKDIGSIVTQKLRAMRSLQENPHDVEALGAMFRANQDMLHWAEAKQNQDTTVADVPGHAVPGASPQTAIPMPVCSGRVGMGMSLLQKMGWKPGEGLGKNREGVLEPLKLEIKMDKKGLITAEDLKTSSKHPATRPTNTGKPGAHNNSTVHNVVQSQGKHPINKLVEFCTRKRWQGPQFELCHESGPDHRKNFLFKVVVNGTEYKPMVTSLTKKQAKTEAAGICLQALRDLK